MITLVGIAPGRAGLTTELLQSHWRGPHAELARRLPGLRGYVQHHFLELLPNPGFDIFSELEFDDLAGLRAAMSSDHYQQEVVPDEKLLVDRARQFGVRMELAASGEAGAVLLVTLHRSEPGAEPGPLTRRLAAVAGQRSWLRAVDFEPFDEPGQALERARIERREVVTTFISRPARIL